MTDFTFESHSEEDTVRLGMALAAVLPESCIIALNGTLGAGKTRLVQAVAEALGIDRHDVVSPTFVLMQEYHGQKSIYHLDAYRIRDEDEFGQLGIDEYFAGAGLVFIEWAERVVGCLPVKRLEIEIAVTGETTRRMVISGNDKLVEQLGAAINRD